MHLRPGRCAPGCLRIKGASQPAPQPQRQPLLAHPSCPYGTRPCCSDPAVTLVGCGWGGGDEAKMQQSFGFGKSRFGAFVDVQVVAAGMGLPKGAGLASLARHVLGLELAKHKKVPSW